jgi:hypothetical protein
MGQLAQRYFVLRRAQVETGLLIQALRRSTTAPFHFTQRSIDTVSAQVHLFWSTFKDRPSPPEPAFTLLAETNNALAAALKSIREILATRAAANNAAIAGVLSQLSEEVGAALDAFQSYGAVGQGNADWRHELPPASVHAALQATLMLPPSTIRSPSVEDTARPIHVRTATHVQR